MMSTDYLLVLEALGSKALTWLGTMGGSFAELADFRPGPSLRETGKLSITMMLRQPTIAPSPLLKLRSS